MRRLLPRSLIGQMALLIGAALLVAQAINFALILNERQKLSLAQNQGPAITRFTSVASDFNQGPPDFRAAILEDSSRRGARFGLGGESAVPAGAREAVIEARLAQALEEAGVGAGEVRAALSTEQFSRSRGRGGEGMRGRDRGAGPVPVLILSARLADGTWLNGRIVTPRGDPWLTTRLGAATILLYIIVLGATLFVATRLTRPLRDLTRAAEAFAGRDAAATVEPRGPEDLRRAIEAFNAMNGRVLALLDEKDHMLGAIGHDLRTPLASLRIRAESVEPEAERERMIVTIEEMTTMLENILMLARSGRPREEARQVDIGALVDTVVEEYRELGREVELMPSGREILAVRATMLKAAIRNLVDNALKYAGSAKVTIRRDGESVVIEVVDDGPGLAPEELEKVLQPFQRTESSRSRDTGGAGLGLAIARAIAESHGGTLRLENAAGGGLAATMTLPARAG